MKPSKIRAMRREMGMTQRELAAALRLQPASGRNTVRDWETGKRPITGPASMALECLYHHGGCNEK